MNRYFLLIGAGLMLANSVASAQSQTEYELQHQLEETERQATVAANLPLLPSEEESFWKLYREYRSADKDMDDERANLMRRLRGTIDDLGNEDGNRLVTDALRVEERRQSLKNRYLKKFSRILPGQRLFRYYQIETKMDAIKRHNWTQFIPLVPVTE